MWTVLSVAVFLLAGSAWGQNPFSTTTKKTTTTSATPTTTVNTNPVWFVADASSTTAGSGTTQSSYSTSTYSGSTYPNPFTSTQGGPASTSATSSWSTWQPVYYSTFATTYSPTSTPSGSTSQQWSTSRTSQPSFTTTYQPSYSTNYQSTYSPTSTPSGSTSQQWSTSGTSPTGFTTTYQPSYSTNWASSAAPASTAFTTTYQPSTAYVSSSTAPPSTTQYTTFATTSYPASTSAPGPMNVGNFSCEGRECGRYQDSSNCSGFYVCGNDSSIVEHKFCDHGLRYNADLQECDFADNVTCPEFSCEGRPCGYYPDDADCSGYYICNNNTAEHRYCNNGLLFSRDSSECDLAGYVNCGDSNSTTNSSTTNNTTFDLDSLVDATIFPEELRNVTSIEELKQMLNDKTKLTQIFDSYQKAFPDMPVRPNTTEETDHMLESFKDNILDVVQHNVDEREGKWNWTKGINKYSALNAEEFNTFYANAVDVSDSNRTRNSSDMPLVHVPTTKDWRVGGFVTPIKSQAQCGSCYAFATVAALESHYAIKHGGTMLDLSEQEIVDCTHDTTSSKLEYGNFGCSGGYSHKSYEYMKQRGVGMESDYPYTAVEGACQIPQTVVPGADPKRPAAVKAYTQLLDRGNEDVMAAYLARYGPVTVTLNTQNWQSYSQGVFSDANGVFDKGCLPYLDGATNHLVLVVGYTEDYWIIKNSWDVSWGIEGYMKLKKGQNLCAIADWATVITDVL